MPLRMRPSIHQNAIEEVLDWRAEVQARIATIGDTFEALDGGPSRSELLRELTWALEDSVAVSAGYLFSWDEIRIVLF